VISDRSPEAALVIVLSGPIGAGKTTLARNLARRGALPLLTRALLSVRAGRTESELGRIQLQRLGEALDRAEGGAWVARAVEVLLATAPEARAAVVDAVRTRAQVDAVRARVATRHVHLTAASDVLKARYERRRALQPHVEATWDEVKSNATEAAVGTLAEIAELTVDTGRGSPGETAALVVGSLGLQRWLD
jgi:adenylate kinase family enzyme